MPYLLAVDGGGTKTEFYISDLQGKRILSFCTGSSNYKSVGIEAVQKHFLEGISIITEKNGIKISDILYSVWGISGCDSPNEYTMIQKIIESFGFPKEKLYVCNDGILAFYAQSTGPGIVIISGTGSIVLGIDNQGSVYRAGGWGYHVSDVGSGYWIGKEALKKTLLYCDGCYKYAPLFDSIRKYFAAEDFEQLPYYITEVTDYFEIAKIARLVTEHNEETALEILKEGAFMLADLANSIYNKLNIKSDVKFPLVLSGGVCRSELYSKILNDILKQKFPSAQILILPEHINPVYGGIRLAQQKAGELK